MTEKQIAAIKKKIESYKKALAADKKFWHGQYHDGNGIRYLPPEKYIAIQDYKGGLKYLNWFNKNFPDDGAPAIFLFQWAFVLFQCNKLKEAEKKVAETIKENNFLFEIFFGKDPLAFNPDSDKNWKLEQIQKYFTYRHYDEVFLAFSEWVRPLLTK